MNEQISFLNDLAAQFQSFGESTEALYSALNSLPETELNSIINEYGDKDR